MKFDYPSKSVDSSESRTHLYTECVLIMGLTFSSQNSLVKHVLTFSLSSFLYKSSVAHLADIALGTLGPEHMKT